MTSEYIELNQSNADLFNIGARDPRYGMQPQTALLAEMRTTQDSLRTLAEETGGLAVVDTNAFAPAFDRIVQANSRYYMLGYRPPTHPRDGKFHKIEVRLKRPGIARHRRGRDMRRRASGLASERGAARARARGAHERRRPDVVRAARAARQAAAARAAS